MNSKAWELSNNKLLDLIAKCGAHARQLDSAGSRGEYSLSSHLLEQAVAAIEGMMQYEGEHGLRNPYKGFVEEED